MRKIEPNVTVIPVVVNFLEFAVAGIFVFYAVGVGGVKGTARKRHNFRVLYKY